MKEEKEIEERQAVIDENTKANNGLVRTGKPRHEFYGRVTSTSVLRSNFIFCLPAAQPEALSDITIDVLKWKQLLQF